MRTIIALLLCAAMLAACAAPPQPAPQPEPTPPAPTPPVIVPYGPPAHPGHTDFLWEVFGGAGRVYLMGTMHVVRDGYNLTPALLEIFGEMDALALETDLLSFGDMMDLFYLSYFPEGETVLEHLSERGRSHLLNMIDAYGLDADYIITNRPFALGSQFLAAAMSGTDFSFTGVDLMLNVLAWERQMPIHALEDYRDMLHNINALPADSQERVLVLPILPPDQALAELERLYELFLSGDEAAMLAHIEYSMNQTMGGDGLPIIFEPVDQRYEYYMLEARDRVMARSIIAHLQSGYNVFVAAGLAHFLGERSIIYFLEEAGYYVSRVDLSGRIAA